MKNQEVRVEVRYTPGYEKRFTAACLAVLKERKTRMEKAGAVTPDKEKT